MAFARVAFSGSHWNGSIGALALAGFASSPPEKPE
jgi:hypothetical protein